MSQVFYPIAAGMTKESVVGIIKDRFDDEVAGYPEDVDINKLSDERMQRFINQWYDATEEGFCEDRIGQALTVQENLLKELANEIAAD